MTSGQRTEIPVQIYNRAFGIAFAANVMLVTANALTFRFAEFVRFLGGREETTGVIVSVGLIGSLFFRAFLGQALDRFGIRRVWLACTILNLLGSLLILTSSDLGPQIYAARIIFVIGLSGMFASSVSHIQGMAPPDRRTEIIGTFGASGFVGMICGAQLGDLVFHMFPSSRLLYSVLFGLAFAFGLFHLSLAYWLTHDVPHERPELTPAIHRLMLRYWPPQVLLVTALMGTTFSMTMTFLTRYATELDLSGIRTFFTAYAITAFTMRMIARRWSRVIGRHRMMALGLLGHAAGHALMITVTNEWHFLPPAMCFGFGHALLFPCVVSLGAGSFPDQYRGTGTTVTLASIDLGTILTAPILGWVIDHQGFHAMFVLTAGTMLCGCVVYTLMTFSIVDSDVDEPINANRKTQSPAVIQDPALPGCTDLAEDPQHLQQSAHDHASATRSATKLDDEHATLRS